MKALSRDQRELPEGRKGDVFRLPKTMPTKTRQIANAGQNAVRPHDLSSSDPDELLSDFRHGKRPGCSIAIILLPEAAIRA